MTRSYQSLIAATLILCCQFSIAGEKAPRRAFIDGTGPGWVTLTEKDFVDVNGTEDTWQFDGAYITGSGVPIGVNRTVKEYKNFEIVYEWMHLKEAGNSGMFLWVQKDALDVLKPNQLPRSGIEIQALDHGYATRFEKQNGKKAEWFTTNGDVFAVGKSTFKPFKPTSPNGSRSFPRKNLGKGHGQWNHYYVRAVNGEVRLWVNGEEVSGGSDCKPSQGYLCLEAEGSEIHFRNIRIRELP
tara:strand:+ start:2280 stop:3002 length:723 start_codon:yes stop_codon:yes gene_type:complete